MPRKILVPAALAAASVLALAGCAGATPGSSGSSAAADGKVQVVASTNVYGDIAAAIGGDRVDVTSIISSTAQDPHSYEASAKDQLTISRAGLIIENGGGYDSFMDSLIDATGTEAPVITAVEFSHDYPGAEAHSDDDHDHGDETDAATPDAADDHDHEGHDHIEGFNEHVWYDPHTIAHVAEEIAHELGEIDAAGAATYERNYATFAAGIDDLEASLADIAAAHTGQKVFVTEPVPLYLIAAAGLENATPPAFSEAVEEGQDVPPATLLEALNILKSGDVSTVIVNAQTGGAETTQVTDAAKAAGIPVLEFTELVPEGDTYLTWMAQNISDLAGTLTR
ncbi:MAG: zinc ABC transporter substrate-binding protein [Microbacterium sp.]|uniref:metal ABC transporter solute-binding protein, Zn/Mn family n=1 Tax=Microbacterium sp. TaxID=51671 RepID=UPI0019C1AE7A|nr:zinc ABC transporter substrate-binding protein [Microbacterium sp.]MBD3757994.1 zinc ABC transporter substrate-binding protein [Microbacterium sp.]